VWIDKVRKSELDMRSTGAWIRFDIDEATKTSDRVAAKNRVPNEEWQVLRSSPSQPQTTKK
jgi:hypothetical protein